MPDWERLILDNLTKGYDVRQPPNKLPPGASPFIENLIFNQGRLETDDGYLKKGAQVQKHPRLIYQFTRTSGTTEVVVITDQAFIIWTVNQWQRVGNGTATTCTGIQAEGTTNLVVADSTGFTVGMCAGIILDNAKQHLSTIMAVPDSTHVTIENGIPAGRTAPDGSAVIETVFLNGQPTLPVTAATFPASDIMLFTNGTDNVKYYNGDVVQDVPNLVTAVGGGNCYASIVRVKDNKVLLYNMNENGTNYAQRVRWCATGDYTDWTTSGDAGFEDLYGSEDPITAAEKLGPYMIVYRENSIERQEWVGSASLLYSFEKTITSDGVSSVNAIIRDKSVHIVVGNQGFYIYDGGYQLVEFGQEVFDKIFGQSATISTMYKINIATAYIDRLKRYYFLIPSDSEVWPSRCWIYSIIDTAWTSRVFSENVSFMVPVEVSSGTTWAEASGETWDDPAWNIAWNDISLMSGSSDIFFIGEDDNIYSYNNTYTDDNGTDIIGEYHTSEIYTETGQIRVNRIEVKAKGSSITVEYSEDSGATWSSYGTLTPGSAYVLQSIWKQLIVPRVMFRFTGTQFGLDRILIEWRTESIY